MLSGSIHIYIADDDEDDCLFFSDALNDLPWPTTLRAVSNGNELMNALHLIGNVADLPHLLFLDLNMPIRNGIDCLAEIRQSSTLCHLPVIIYSTSAQEKAVDFAFKNGAVLFLKKPDSFIKLKRALDQILSMKWNDQLSQPTREKFLVEF